MKYLDYINYLKSNNIILFDHDYRISYNNIKYYYKSNNLSQMGGGEKPAKITKLNSENLNMIVNLSLSSNPHYLSILSMH